MVSRHVVALVQLLVVFGGVVGVGLTLGAHFSQIWLFWVRVSFGLYFLLAGIFNLGNLKLSV
jgi:hypothetical protein